jgi:hypothetical protein
MIRYLLPVLVFASHASPGAETYEFAPYEQSPGGKVRIETSTSTRDGKVIFMKDGVRREGKIELRRTRTMERQVKVAGETRTVSYRILSDSLVTTRLLDGQPTREITRSPLIGKTISGTAADDGPTRLTTRQQAANDEVRRQIAEVEAFENRNWLPSRPVKVGDSWPIDAAFVRHLLLRDLRDASIESSMTFKEVREIDGVETAIFTAAIQSVAVSGGDDTPAGASASINLTGLLHVSLDTMLDTRLVLEGTLTSTNRDETGSTTLLLPLRGVIEKRKVPAPPAPRVP